MKTYPPHNQPSNIKRQCVNQVTNRIYYLYRNKTCQNLKIADCLKRICHQKLLFSWSLISATVPSYRPDEQSFAAYNKICQKAEEELLQLLICQQQKNSSTDAGTICSLKEQLSQMFPYQSKREEAEKKIQSATNRSLTRTNLGQKRPTASLKRKPKEKNELSMIKAKVTTFMNLVYKSKK